MSARVFHVGYDENLLRVREMILQQRASSCSLSWATVKLASSSLM
jgi:hypothetical protein